MTGVPGTDSHENHLIYEMNKRTDKNITELAARYECASRKAKTAKTKKDELYYKGKADKLQRTIKNLVERKEMFGELLLDD